MQIRQSSAHHTLGLPGTPPACASPLGPLQSGGHEVAGLRPLGSEGVTPQTRAPANAMVRGTGTIKRCECHSPVCTAAAGGEPGTPDVVLPPGEERAASWQRSPGRGTGVAAAPLLSLPHALGHTLGSTKNEEKPTSERPCWGLTPPLFVTVTAVRSTQLSELVGTNPGDSPSGPMGAAGGPSCTPSRQSPVHRRNWSESRGTSAEGKRVPGVPTLSSRNGRECR